MIVLHSKQSELSILNESAHESDIKHYNLLAKHYADLMQKVDRRQNYEQWEKYFDLYMQVSDKRNNALDNMINDINNTLGCSDKKISTHLKIV